MEQNAKVKGGFGRWFREAKAELKKVVWPTLTKVRQNTGIVLVYIAIVGVVIWTLDWLFLTGILLLVNR